MTLLVILLAARPHVAEGVEPDAPLGDFHHVLSPDGVVVASSGRTPVAQLPRADTVVAVVPPTDLAWHRVTIPKAPAARLRQALAGLLEEQLLDEPDDTHLAVADKARAGEPGWVAAVNRPWLARQLAALEAAGVTVDRLVPGVAPSDLAQGHFFSNGEGHGDDARASGDLWLAYSSTEAAFSLRAVGGLARSLLPSGTAEHPSPNFTATPAVAAAAERWLGVPVPVRSEAEQALTCARSPWNLRQFELAARRRGLRAVSSLGRQFLGPSWRPVRWGLAALVLVQVLGLNAWAWAQQRQIEQRRAAVDNVLRSTHPQVRSILDAPVQMQRETELLRVAAGKAGDDDLETLLGLAAAGWPDGRAPLDRLRFEPGRLVLPATGWDPAAVQQLRSRLEAAGGQLESTEADLTISRAVRRAAP
jgi:general secretion pathway protein L